MNKEHIKNENIYGTNDYREKQFDSFLNKTIILSSKQFYKKERRLSDREKTIVDDENFYSLVEEYMQLNNKNDILSRDEEIEYINNILEKTVFPQDSVKQALCEVADTLELYFKTISKIKKRAIDKLRRCLEVDSK